jgi:AcrR family transcriptional regulator
MTTNKNVERGQATRAQIVEIAKRLFTERGYDGTSIEAVLAESGVSRGALYHHFDGKEALFWAVLEDVSVLIQTKVAEATADAPDPIAELRASCLTWVRLASDPVVRQTVLIDAPAVFGWQRWREVDEQSSLGPTRAAVAYAAESGTVDREHVNVFAHIVLAATNEVAMTIAGADDAAAALRDGEAALGEFLDRLLGKPAA